MVSTKSKSPKSPVSSPILKGALLLLCSSCSVTSSTGVHHGSPKDVIASYQSAVVDRNTDAILASIDPSVRDSCRTLLLKYESFSKKGVAVQRLVKQSFGVNGVNYYRKRLFEVFDIRLDQILLWSLPGGVVAPERLSFEGDDKARRVLIDGQSTNVITTRVGDLWYVAFQDPPHDEYMRILGQTYEDLGGRFDFIARGIEAGTVNQENAGGILSGSEDPPGMPKKQSTIEREDWDYHWKTGGGE